MTAIEKKLFAEGFDDNKQGLPVMKWDEPSYVAGFRSYTRPPASRPYHQRVAIGRRHTTGNSNI